MSQRPINISSTTPTLPGVKTIIAVGSGKGGVGKSTVALNLAVALQQLNLSVGLLDADIYGPNQAHLLNNKQPADILDNRYQPVIAHDLQTMSLSYLVDDESPMIWRGPMVSKMLQQMLLMTAWNNLDTLVIDLPPGTGDVPLTLSKKASINGAIIVTTPQTLATADADKGINMFKKIQIPVFGIIENMSYHQCQQCGHQDPIFGSDGAQKLARHHQLDLLGALPLHTDVRITSDLGTPLVSQNPEHNISQSIMHIAHQVQQKLNLHFAKNKSTFPNIVIE
jgi:ATP-binding protein involved in chromosome partitioning